ncbi:hypothetical protein [Archangium sp.]|uniref:hypothetical protein n=1 Tax=Archangium sp. TaxID=1872627 RepID=UPI00286ADD2F|nr:hypothetical protein [Archangium sp.]
MLPSDKARTIAARVAASVIRNEVRSRSFLELYLSAAEQEQVVEELRLLAATLEVLCASGLLTRPPHRA